MRNAAVLILAALAFTTAAAPQEDSSILRQAGHCLVEGRDAKKLLRHDRKELNLGYYIDTTAYPGERTLYVIDYEDTNPSKAQMKGMAFVFFLGDRDNRTVFRLENNATFVRRRRGNGIDFIEPPLGGVWTEEHLEAAIEHINEQGVTAFRVKDLKEKFPDVRCESYSDAR
jgi:hypothetical protein